MKENNTFAKRKVSHFYSCFIAFLPIISIYASGINGLTLGDVCLGVFLIYTMLNNRKSAGCNKNTGITKVFVVLICYYFVSSFLSLLFQFNPPVVDVLVRITRFIFYSVCIIVVSKKYFDYNLAYKWVIKISVLATIYVIIQYFLYFNFSFILNGYLKVIPIYLREYVEFDYSVSYTYQFFRATSFFLEPAHYSQYAILGLCLSLFQNTQKQLRTIMVSAVISLGIILSTSIQGIGITAILWIIWVFVVYWRNKNAKGVMILLILIIVVPLFLYLIFNTSIVQNALSRISTNQGNLKGGAFSARFGGFLAIGNMTGIFRFIGMGFGQVADNLWMSSAAYIWYGTGIIGLILTVFLFIKCFSIANTFIARMICFIYFVLFWNASIFNSYMIVFYISFICFAVKSNSKTRLPQKGEGGD